MKITEKLNEIIDEKKEEKKSGGGPNPVYDIGAEAEIVIRGKDGKVKGKYKANSSQITL